MSDIEKSDGSVKSFKSNLDRKLTELTENVKNLKNYDDTKLYEEIRKINENMEYLTESGKEIPLWVELELKTIKLLSEIDNTYQKLQNYINYMKLREQISESFDNIETKMQSNYKQVEENLLKKIEEKKDKE